MPTSTFIPAADGLALAVSEWLPEGEPRAIVQIAHGMAEHSGRYKETAERLVASGYVVIANDHRGHGATAEQAAGGQLGHFDDQKGWAKTVRDLGTIGAWARNRHPGLPLVLMGHSMGSLLSRSFAIRHPEAVDALVLMGTAAGQGTLGSIGIRLAELEAHIRGPRHRSALMDKLSFSAYNKAFQPARTEFDWLSRDEAEVDAYIADPWAGQLSSSAFWGQLLRGIREINDPGQLTPLHQDLPVLILSGDRDPVGGFGTGVRKVEQLFADAGIRDLTAILYPGARHELLHEQNRAEVMADLIAWLDARFADRS